MFDSSVWELDGDRTVTAFEANQRTLVEESCRTLVLAAHWADLHSADAVPAQRVPGQETPRHPGGEGTPAIAGFAPAELGLLLGATAGAASRLIGDALDLRHRLPRCWRRVLNAEVPGHHARRVAQATRHLSKEAAARVDAEIAPKLTVLSYGRLDTCVEAAVYKADPAAAEAEAELAMRERFVRLGRTSRFGLKLIIARLTAGDALYVNAMVARLAEILRQRGDLDPLEVRRSKAFGLLGQPAEALRLLYEYAERDNTEDPDGTDGTDDTEDPAEDPAEDLDVADHRVDGTGDDARDTAAGDGAGTEDPEGPEPDPEAEHRSVQIVPPPFDPAKARPSTVIYIHLSEEALTAGRGVVRMEGVGPVLLSQLRRLLGDHTIIKLQPVIDLNDEPAPVDCYEVPDRMREHLILTNPADRFPYAGGMARGPDRTADLDHTIPYLPMAAGGPPGQTRPDQLAPLVRFHHRVRTHGDLQVRQPEPGTVVWRTRHGRIYLVNNSGTHALGAGTFAHAIWQTADPRTLADAQVTRLPWSVLAG